LFRLESEYYGQGDCSGTYTRDSESGRYATLLVKERRGFFDNDYGNAPTAAQILSPYELKLTSNLFSFYIQDGVQKRDRMITLTK
jgi:hypothetical protein